MLFQLQLEFITLPTQTQEIPAPAHLAHPKCSHKRTSTSTSKLTALCSHWFRETQSHLPPCPPPADTSSSILYSSPPFLLYLLFYPLVPIIAFPCLPIIFRLHICFKTAFPEPRKHTRGKILTLKHFLCSLQHTNP